MRFAPVLPLLLALGCAGGAGSRTDRGEFYERLDTMLGQWNAVVDARNFKQQRSIETELTRYSTPNYEWVAKDAIEEKDDDRRNLAVWALAFCRQPAAAEILRRVLDDAHPQVRSSAAFALGRQGSGEVPLDRLFALLDDPIARVREGALFALRQLLRPGQASTAQLARITALLDDPSPEVRSETALVLGRQRMAASIDPLCRKALSDAAMLVRLHASMALGGYGGDGSTAIPFLVETLRDNESAVVEAAWWALKKITGLDFDRSYHLWRDWFEQDQRRFEYVCRDHAEILKEVPGYCPTCGKRLERQPKAVRKVEDDIPWVCPNHPEVTGGPGGKCSKCKAALIPKK